MAGPASSGLHTRAGNAMGRTRDGLLDGALASIEREGLRGTTMAGISVRSGVAKATLYNHFRTKADVLAGIVEREVDRVADLAGSVLAEPDGSLADALDRAAEALGALPAARRLATTEPAALTPLIAPDPAPTAVAPGWRHAQRRTGELLGAPADGPLVDLVLRWLAGQLLVPAEPETRRHTATLLAHSAASAAAAGPESVSPATPVSPEPAPAGTTGTST